jgi:GAF domain-containing protein
MSHLPEELIPADDVSRLRSLHNYQVLNTTPEPIFDEYVALAAQLFNLPISLISLVDEEEVFFKANVGMPVPQQVARPDSLCSAAILQEEVLTYNDLSTEGCSLINPMVAQSAGLRFYAGAALKMPDGHNIGSLCVIGREPRSISAEEEELLMQLAQLTSMTIELRSYYLRQNRVDDWLKAQRKLQGLLSDEAAMARYLTSRLGTLSGLTGEHAPMQRRLVALRHTLTTLLAEAGTPLPG